MAQLEFGLEEVGLQPGHGFGVEAVLAERVGGRAGEGDVRAEVVVQRVLPAERSCTCDANPTSTGDIAELVVAHLEGSRDFRYGHNAVLMR